MRTVFLAALAVFLMGGTIDRPLIPGDTAQEIRAGASYNGAIPSLKSLRGHVVVLDFWGEYCVPCVSLLPHLAELDARFAKRGVQTIAVLDAPMNDLKKRIMKTANAQFPVAVEARPTHESYGVQVTPTAMVIDRRGKIFWIGVGGEAIQHDLERVIRAALRH